MQWSFINSHTAGMPQALGMIALPSQRYKRSVLRHRSLALLLGCVAVNALPLAQCALAETKSVEIKTPADARLHGLESLRRAVRQDGGVPLPGHLDEFVKDRAAAIRLGKALFWDMQVGSDGVQACGSCHFHAGADNRATNQLNPNLLTIVDRRDGDVRGYFAAPKISDIHFETKQPNERLAREDFPFVKSVQALRHNADGTVGPGVNNSNDIASSMGMFFTRFDGVQPGLPVESGTPLADSVWNTGARGHAVRRVEPRNSPSVINAVFNFTNFWDGRASAQFNGQNNIGDQDLGAAILVNRPGMELAYETISLGNASLASQAVSPLTSFSEMSFGDPAHGNSRILPEIGYKLLRGSLQTGVPLTPLALQNVHRYDSVLGPLSNAPLRGLSTTYKEMIQKAFADQYWNSLEPLQGPKNVDFTHMEANFGLFFGLAVALYQSTLVADHTPFDRWMETGRFNFGFGKAALAGLNLFVDQGECIACHGGPEFTNASIRSARGGSQLIRAMPMSQGNALYDNGFYNISVTPTTDDIGRGDVDAFGQPLAFSRLALFDRLGVMPIPFPIPGNGHLPAVAEDDESIVCEDANANHVCEPTEAIRGGFQRVAVDGAFKTPGLRNSVLTGPYFHNGSMATLRQVVQFYNRGGNFCQSNLSDLDPHIRPLGLNGTQEKELVAFLVSLTDMRVKYRAAPFDHPEIRIPDDGLDAVGNRKISAVGAWGAYPPLKTFLNLNPQDAIFTPAEICSKNGV